MEKKYHFQGFRKFSIKTRLVIALLMISIIPLVGISGYSFHIFSAALQEKLSSSILPRQKILLSMIPMEIFFMIWAMTGSIRKMWTGSCRSLRSRTRMCGLMHILTVTEIF